MELKNSVLVYIELHDGAISPVSIELLGKGRKLADSHNHALVGLVIGEGAKDKAQEVISYGADAVIVATNSTLNAFDSALYTQAAAGVIKKYEPNAVLIGGTNDGRDLGGRLSAALQVGLVADCIDVHYDSKENETLTWIRPAYTGKLFVKIVTTTFPQLGTVAQGIFARPASDANRTGEVIAEEVALGDARATQKVTDFTEVPPTAAQLTLDSDFVIGCGRGVGDEEGMKKVQEFAAKVGAGFGVTKPLVDKAWVGHELQIGITGKKIAPKVYIALGISGAIQHKLGIQDAEYIIAINKDPDAPIFKFAHYGIVGDLFEALPVLEEELKKLKH